MNKKTYINPDMVVVKIATQMMLASSPNSVSPDDPDEYGAPSLDGPNMFGF